MKGAVAAAVISALVLAGCGGSGAPRALGAAPAATTPAQQNAQATITISVPAQRVSASARKPQYVSPSAQSIAIVAGGITTTGNLTPSSPGCVTTPGAIHEYAIPTTGSQPNGITAGPDGNLWFTEHYGSSGNGTIAKVTTAGTFTEYPLLTFAGPTTIAAGPDGNLWFIEQAENIAKITPGGTLTEFAIPIPGGFPYPAPETIAAGPDGNLYSTSGNGNNNTQNTVWKTTPGGAFTGFAIPTALSFPLGITTGPDGNLWLAEANFGAGKIAKLTPGGAFVEYAIPTTTGSPAGIAAGSDGNLWFTEGIGNKIGRVTTAGTFTEFPVPTANSDPQAITAGPDGALWFTENNVGNIGRITTSGSVSEYPLPSSTSIPFGIASGPDGNVWFTEDQGNNVGRIAPPSLACSITATTPIGSSIAFAVTLYDGLNGTGNKLASNLVASNITPAGPNNVALVLNGVVDHIDVHLGLALIAAGVVNSVPVTVNARDKDNNIIVGPGNYVDANGNPLTIHLTDSDVSGATTLVPAALTAPAAGIALNYNGGAVATASVSATVSGGAIAGNITGATLGI
jgi:streptogramin lyase